MSIFGDWITRRAKIEPKAERVVPASAGDEDGMPRSGWADPAFKHWSGKTTEESLTDKGNTPLMVAAYIGDLRKMAQLIEEGADINARDNDGKTALMWAAWHGYKKEAQLLIDNGADVNARDKTGWTALTHAVHPAAGDSGTGDREMTQLLMGNGAVVTPVTEHWMSEAQRRESPIRKFSPPTATLY